MGKKLIAVAAATGTLAAVAGCGDSGTTTVIQSGDASTPTATVTEKTTTVTEKATGASSSQTASNETESGPSGSPPDVVDLTLPTAQKMLKDAGYKADVSNTDTALGIIVPENYTVCEQDDPVGNIVPILAQKYGC
jgi:hypothetical protein